MRKNSRKNKMNTAKLGVIFIVAAMALAGVGAGYAAWFDTITIQGTVNTGSVGWDVTEYSGTWVWKVYNAGDTGNGAETVVTHDRDETYSEDEGFLVASSYAEQTMTGDTDPVAVDDSVTVVFNNLFPCIDFEADFTVHYTGSVPGKINSITFRDLWPDTANEILIDKYTTLEVTIGKQDAAGTYHWTSLPIDQLDGYQLHYCNLIRVVMTIHLPQIDDNGEPTDYLMDLTGSFGLDVEVIQWNEYVAP